MNSSSEIDVDEPAVYTFGQNSYGELAHGDTTERNCPTRVQFCTGLNAVNVACGNESIAILCANGDVYCCGYNDSGQCGIGGTNRTASLKLVGSLHEKGIKQISAANGCEHVAAVSEKGELYTFGYNARGQLGQNSTTPIPTPSLVKGLEGENVTKTACSYFHTIAVVDDDTVYAFGRNDFGQLGIGDGIDKHIPQFIGPLGKIPVLSVACGQYHTVISLASGGVMSFGKNDFGQLGVELPTVHPTPVMVVSPLSNEIVTQVACGYYHTVAVTDEGKLYSFGRNDFGQLGLGHKQNKWRPAIVETLEVNNIVQVACGAYHTLTLSEDGKVFPFGRNNHGQLGLKNNIDSSVPQVITELRGIHVRQIAAGFYHSACITGVEANIFAQRQQELSHINTLSFDFKKLLNNPARSDVTFIVENSPIYAHRCILMARCDPLDRMVNGPMRESQEIEIIIPDHSHAVFLAMLEYLYTDDVEQLTKPNIDLEFMMDLLVISDQYLIDNLKAKCENTVQAFISVSNVAVMLNMADKRQAIGLRKRCMDFVMNNFGSVIGTPAFSELPQDLLQEVLFAASRLGVAVRNQSL